VTGRSPRVRRLMNGPLHAAVPPLPVTGAKNDAPPL